MITKIPEILLSEFCEFISSQMGLYFPKERWKDIERGIYASAVEFNYEDIEYFIRWLMSGPLSKDQIEVLSSYLTIGETYFFREKESYKVLQDFILPEIIRNRRNENQQIRIWSAGCSTGEEAYSIAIIINKLLPDFDDWNITIVGTDINPRSIKKASDGIYRNWSFRDVSSQIKQTYFTPLKDSQYAIFPKIRKMVKFFYLNLVEDVYPSLLNNTNAMDIILCRNVLMYFSPNLQNKVIQKLNHSLLEDGCLIVSSCEVPHVQYKYFAPINYPGVTLYKKKDTLSKTGQIVQNLQSNETFIYNQNKECQVSPQYNFDLTTSQYNSDLFDKTKIKSNAINELKNEGNEQIEKTNNVEVIQNLYADVAKLIQENRFQEATDLLNTLLSKNQRDSKAMSLFAKLYANQGRLSESLEWCEKSINLDKLNPEYYFLRAEIFQETNKIDEATMSLKKALYLDQNYVLAHFTLGNLAHQQLKFKEANKYFVNVLSLLQSYPKEESLPGSDGITAGRLIEIVNSMTMRSN